MNSRVPEPGSRETYGYSASSWGGDLLVPREREFRTADDLQFVFAADLRLQIRLVRRRLDETDVDRMFGDTCLDRLGIGDDQPRPHVRIFRLEFPEDPRQQEFGDRGRGTDQERAGDLAGHLGHAHVHFLGKTQDLLGILEHQLAGRCQGNPPMPTIEEPGVEMLLELLDLERHCRLRHEQYLGSLGKRQLFGDGVENLQPAIGHGYSFPLGPR